MNRNKKTLLILTLLWIIIVGAGGLFSVFVILKHNQQLKAANLDLLFNQIISDKDDSFIKREASDIAFKTGLIIYIKAENFSWQSRDEYDYPKMIEGNREKTWFHIRFQKAGYYLKKGKHSALFIVDLFRIRTAIIFIIALIFLCASPAVLFCVLLKQKNSDVHNSDLSLKEKEMQLPLLQKENYYVEASPRSEQDEISGEQTENDYLRSRDALKINNELFEQKLNQDYSQITRVLADLVRVKDHLLIDVNQKLKVPLARIKLAADFLDDGAGLEIQKDVTLMQNIIEDVFKTFRTAYTTDALKLEDIDLLYFFNGLRQKQRIDRSMLLLKIDKGSVIKADRRLFTILIENLLDNAYCHAKDSGQPVTVICEPDKCVTTVTIRNHGPAIPADDLPYIFDPFYQVKDQTQSKAGKTGLGLTLCRRIADLHGFDIRVLSSEEFTDFIVSSERKSLLLSTGNFEKLP
ncbi:MAG: HAMP domain-containing histidine kinase [Spirochaetes bacterium]|nr:HAMP domain-containing histidine kinase [Spirochaetota bacterium]MBN2771957.1 HAMP domain-containing histidine kinase [Spirochaetota bacterium]